MSAARPFPERHTVGGAERAAFPPWLRSLGHVRHGPSTSPHGCMAHFPSLPKTSPPPASPSPAGGQLGASTVAAVAAAEGDTHVPGRGLSSVNGDTCPRSDLRTQSHPRYCRRQEAEAQRAEVTFPSPHSYERQMDGSTLGNLELLCSPDPCRGRRHQYLGDGTGGRPPSVRMLPLPAPARCAPNGHPLLTPSCPILTSPLVPLRLTFKH